mmetsp:Transcript_44905/g.112931  ORF Transcript_44905/g.112931 Transcript_44905/m.112931 type:complete len:529 (+) Transcript_44905:65-1651(+)
MVAEVVVIVDPVSTGGCVAAEAMDRGYRVVVVWCSEMTAEMRAHVPDRCRNLEYHAEVVERGTITNTAAAVRAAAGGMPIIACIVGADTGITLADHLSMELKVRTNGTLPLGDRRNKSVQQRAVKAFGLRAVREVVGKTWGEVVGFVDQEPLPIVVKPVESAGSDGVKLCRTTEEAEAHLRLLMHSQRRCGSQDAAVLCQEFLKGSEYVVDHVSRDGIHKCVMVWLYDKRPANGSAFVYHSVIPVDSNTAVAKTLIKYTQGVLNALKLYNGPSHGEVIMTSDGPCLVEMNCRCHGWDGAWIPLAKKLTGGYAQPEVALDAYVDGSAFAEVPSVYLSPFKALGQLVVLVSFYSGVVKSTPGYDRMLKLTSFVALHTAVEIGSKVERTVDLFTAVGVLILANSDPEKIEVDLMEVRKMEREGLFTFQEEEEEVVVSPTHSEPVPVWKWEPVIAVHIKSMVKRTVQNQLCTLVVAACGAGAPIVLRLIKVSLSILCAVVFLHAGLDDKSALSFSRRPWDSIFAGMRRHLHI